MAKSHSDFNVHLQVSFLPEFSFADTVELKLKVDLAENVSAKMLIKG